ncbi:hypothetical protein N7532_007877 [Penicillium argentinense]|uniref:HPP transmembrane region domain-containing protein n=1 Tax=Penicillium argentinense TaxID=1131581 RepID=A0A9W9EW94_9EURO|nr:uncharacterized protein N7532_007877 [Penicillium argentinense]KAJ5089193.1 hypothetical protein N7532_007877 [Penicillium argentinense]
MSASRLSRFPTWLSHWLGHRAEPPEPLPQYLVAAWSFIAAFCGLSVIQGLFNYSEYFTSRHVPGIIASYVGTTTSSQRHLSQTSPTPLDVNFYTSRNTTNPSQGASAVLCFGAIESPLAQPRALIFGHFFSALIGICITKLFSLIPDEARFESLRWLAASLSTAIAIVVMQLTGTTHPPAGATALLPATDDAVWNLSWYLLPVVLLSSSLLMVCALLFNNMHRRYPVFWIAPSPAKPVPAPSSAPAPVESTVNGEAYSSQEKLPKESV